MPCNSVTRDSWRSPTSAGAAHLTRAAPGSPPFPRGDESQPGHNRRVRHEFAHLDTVHGMTFDARASDTTDAQATMHTARLLAQSMATMSIEQAVTALASFLTELQPDLVDVHVRRTPEKVELHPDVLE